jgi:hypothetical protein
MKMKTPTKISTIFSAPARTGYASVVSDKSVNRGKCDRAGNDYDKTNQDEPCIHPGSCFVLSVKLRWNSRNVLRS